MIAIFERTFPDFGHVVREIINHLHPMFIDSDVDVWNHDYVKALHRTLVRGTGCPGYIGEYRDQPVSITGEDGFEYFITCPHMYIEKEMDSLFSWLSGSPFDPICTAAIFFHEFESIHPFRDGNGRTGRALMQMLLRKLGLKNCGLCKFESHLLGDSETYYRLLAYADHENDYGPFILYFAEALRDAYMEAHDVFSEKDRLRDSDEVTRALVSLAKSEDSFTISRASQYVPSVHENTIRSRLNRLIELGIIRREGGGRSVTYRFDDPLEKVRSRVNDSGSDMGLPSHSDVDI